MQTMGSSNTGGTQMLVRPPAPPGTFTGREAEIRELRTVLGEGETTLLGLRGPEGIGKTTLALALARELEALYPEAQLYVDLQGDTRPLAPAAVMQQVIHAHAPAARLPDELSNIAAAYRRSLQGKRMLLLFDNAAGGSQLRALIPPAGCLMLVTAGERLNLPGLRVVGVGSLSPADATTLLLKLAPRIGPLAPRLSALCQQVPLALHLVGSILATQQDLDPASCANRLEQKRRWQAGSITTAISLTYDLLSSERRRLWRRLAVFPTDFDTPAAAAVWGQDHNQTARQLAKLVDYGVLEYHAAIQRYRMHGQVRLAARALLTTAEHQEASRRHAAHYLDVLATADRLLLKGGQATLRGLRQFDLERSNILAGQARAAEQLDTDRSMAQLTREYVAVGIHVLSYRQPLRGQRDWLEAGVSAARRLGDRKAESTYLQKLGSVYRHLGQPVRAVQHYQQCLRLARELGDRPGEGIVLGKLGLAYADQSNARQAIKYYEQSLRIARSTANRSEEARTSWNLGLAYEELGDLPAAIAAMQVCVDFEREIRHANAEADGATVERLRARLAALAQR